MSVPVKKERAPSKGKHVNPVLLSHVVYVTRPETGRTAEWQSYDRDALVPLSAELGLDIQTINIKRPKFRVEEQREQAEEEMGLGLLDYGVEGKTPSKLYRISLPLNDFLPWSVPLEIRQGAGV